MIFPEKEDNIKFAYFLEFMLALARMQDNSTFIRKKLHSWHISGAVASITQSTNVLLIRYTAGSILKTKKKHPIFMVLHLSIELRCCNKNKTKIFIKRLTHKKW